MAWTRVDDNFLGHAKTVRAAEILGRFGLGRVLVVWHQGQAHANRYLTDGFLSRDVVKRFHDDPQPLTVAAALVSARLWEEAEGGYCIHDYLDYNPSRDTVLGKRAKDLQRKQGRPESDPDGSSIPPTFHADSARKHHGITNGAPPDSTDIPLTFHADSEAVPQTFRADSTALARAPGRARPVPRSQVRHGHDTVTSPGGRRAPLGARGRIDIAWPGRPPVPGRLHLDFIEKLGGDSNAAEEELRAWYPVVAAAFEGQPIGDDDFKFWRARFAEWVGTTVNPGHGREDATLARKLGPTYADDWFTDCHHDPKCETGPMHRMRLSIDEAKTSAASPPAPADDDGPCDADVEAALSRGS